MSLPSGLAVRVIPCLDVSGGRVVKGVRFQDLRELGDPAEAALRYAEQGADEIVFLDIGAAPEERGTALDWVRRAAERVFVPLTVGGGVRSVEDARALLGAGADKVGVNTAAVERPELLSELARRFGSQCVVLSIDARRRPAREGSGGTGSHPTARPLPDAGAVGGDPVAPEQERRVRPGAPGDGGSGVGCGPVAPGQTPGDGARDRTAVAPRAWEVVTRGGRRPTGHDAVAWAREGVERGAGEILLTSIDADGTRSGYDLELLDRICRAVPVPVIASGGAGRPEHLARALEAGAAAVLAASIFHEGTWTVAQVKEVLAAEGFPVRPVVPATVVSGRRPGGDRGSHGATGSHPTIGDPDDVGCDPVAPDDGPGAPGPRGER